MSSVATPGSPPPTWRTWLILGRVSNLPTVWSNCLAAWLLGDGGPWTRLLPLCVGASSIYVGGMFLNDACDAEFDRRYRPERPIPSGTLAERSVWIAATAALVGGWLVLAALGRGPAFLGLMLISAVVVYDFTHKLVSISPLIMALCRHLLFLAAGSAAWAGVVGETMWSGLVLGMYVVGLSYVAQKESLGGVARWWPLIFLLTPIPLAVFMNAPTDWTHHQVLMPVIIFVVWLGRSLSHLFRGEPAGSRLTVSNLLAGIVLVDVVAVMPTPWPWGIVFLALFGCALLLQRVVPAT